MAKHSTPAAAGDKPSKPYSDFPLFPHATGRWCKKIRGKFHYFGPWSDPMAALEEYNRVRDHLHAGLPRPAGVSDTFTLRDLANRFLTSKRKKVDAGAIGERQFQDLYGTCDRLIGFFGPAMPVAAIGPREFERLHAHLAEKRGPVALGNEVQRARSVFTYAWLLRDIPAPVDFGPEFRKPPRAQMRAVRNARPPKMLTPAQVKKLITLAGDQMKAMILLGVNCGFGNTDVALLPETALDLKRGVIAFPRPKTHVVRRATLWPETVKALRKALQTRPEARHDDDAGLVFITAYGRRWVRNETRQGEGDDKPQFHRVDSIGLMFGRLLTEAGIEQERLGYYCLRHIFETIAGEVGDQPAVDRVMGHTDENIAAHYREWSGDDREDARLRRVTDHVREWLYAKAKPSSGRTSRARA